ncbi:MAG: metallophosphoesterase family protein [Burkholderiales bacterium]
MRSFPAQAPPPRSAKDAIRIGLISDTHGLVRDEALAALEGCRHIIHAGDIDTPDVLVKLRELAPITVVRGNNDRGAWAESIPAFEVVEFGAVLIYIRHDESELDVDPVAAGFRVMVFGHSHKPVVESRDGVLFVNPGSAGPRRFKLPIAVGELLISGDRVDARIIELGV